LLMERRTILSCSKRCGFIMGWKMLGRHRPIISDWMGSGDWRRWAAWNIISRACRISWHRTMSYWCPHPSIGLVVEYRRWRKWKMGARRRRVEWRLGGRIIIRRVIRGRIMTRIIEILGLLKWIETRGECMRHPRITLVEGLNVSWDVHVQASRAVLMFLCLSSYCVEEKIVGASSYMRLRRRIDIERGRRSSWRGIQSTLVWG
jgi:hypothetical protein